MNRYLLNISYIGTRFRGIQKSINKTSESQIDLNSVQGVIEFGLKKIQPINNINIVLSSRTDAGVHALNSTVHVDLLKIDGHPYNPNYLTRILNHTFYRNDWHVRVLNTRIISSKFHCRFNAKSRTYLYRLAVKKSPCIDSLHNDRFLQYIPIEEIDRCFFVQNHNFDIEKVQQATKLLQGRHDFRSFAAIGQVDKDHPRFTLREITKITISPSRSTSLPLSSDISNEIYNYWDFKVTGASFLYKQVRRMVAVLIAVGQGKLQIKDCYEMLTIPSKNSWCSQATTVPPHGLYLCCVEYNTNELNSAIEEKSDELKLFNKIYQNEFLRRTTK